MADLIPFAAPPDTAPAPLLVSAADLAKLLGIGLRTLRSHDSAGKLPRPVRIGGAVRWHLDEIRAWLGAGAPDRETWERMRPASPKLPAR